MKKILVVDNDKFILEFMNDVLSERGHEVVTAEGGLSAVDILKTYTPDIIFVDLVMPDIEGKQLCKIIRSMPELRDVFIVILSAIAAEEDLKIKESWADACIAKGPVNDMAKHVVAIVDRLGLTPTKGLPGETIDVEGIFSRNITKELLSIKNHFQIILGKISEGVLEVTSGGRIIYTNSTALSIIGIPEEKLLGSHFIDLFSAEDRHRVAELVESSGDKPQITIGEFVFGLNGRKVTLQFLPIVEYWPTSLVIINDITDRKQAEEALRESEKKYRGIFDESIAAVYLFDDKKNFLDSNQAGLDLLGYSREELLNMSITDVDADPVVVLPAHEQLLGGERIINYEHLLKRKDGKVITVLNNSRPIIDTHGHVIGMQSTIINITDRKQAEDALRESEERLRIAGKAAYDLIYEWNVTNDELEWLGDIDGLLGYEPGAISRDIVAWLDLIHPEDSGQLENAVGLHRTATEPIRYEYRIKHRDGTYRCLQDHGLPMLDKQGRPYKWIGVCADITDRKRAEEALRESEEKYRNILESMEEGYYEVDLAGNFTFLNDAMSRNRGCTRDELMGMNNRQYMDPETAKKVYKVYSEIYRTGRPVKGHQWEIMRKDGTKGYVEVSAFLIKDSEGNPVGCRGIVRDVTDYLKAVSEKEKAIVQLQQSQKMEAVGTLAGGIAHDFNNILAIILGNTELASDGVPDSNPASESLKEVYRASIRAKDMIRQLLAFSRKSDEESTPIDMAAIIKESMQMLRSAIPTSVEFKQHISDDPCSVMGDATQINQIVMNLVINAADAMSEEGGILDVTLENILQEEKTCFDCVLAPGPYVRLRMKDTGEGIEPKIMDRIFEPYYTTKEVGKGTGMGLSVIHGIVKRHGGGIWVKSTLGKGTVFEIYFPALEETAEEEKEPEGEIKGGSERILFVDDEESLANLNRRRLERLGYDVKSTTKPLEALEWFNADPDQFDVIITDMTMPRMTGDRLAAEVLKIRPHMPVIICTGYSERMSAKKAAALGVSKYIEKPIDLRNLASAIREVLEGK